MLSSHYIEEEKKAGHDAYLINNAGFNTLLMEEDDTTGVHIIEFLFILLFLSYGLYASEKDKTIKYLLRTTKRGRNVLFKKKFFAGLSASTVLYLFWTFFDIIYVNNYFGLEYINAPVQSIENFAEFPYDISILEFIIGYFLIRYIFFTAIYCLMLFVSNKADSRFALILNFVIFIVPSLLVFLGMEVIDSISLKNILSFTDNFMNDTSYIRTYLILCILTAASGAAAMVLCIDFKDKKGRQEHASSN